MDKDFITRRIAFSEAKDKYEKLREDERKLLSKYMYKKGLKVVEGSSAGKGKKYTSGGRLDPPFNLKNWKWVEIENDNKTVIISLNPYDIDPNTGNIHVLYDRIGIYKTSKEKTFLYSTEMIITKYELPLSEDDLKQLYELIKPTERNTDTNNINA